ncbi:MAG: 4'-phosphopantetheinyl transferase superfamily protein [Lachnospiraceae bacterium]|nr:4'-phosphopantetheinyl transferase superfamily protein [Lachnospiraceae bacterium]
MNDFLINSNETKVYIADCDRLKDSCLFSNYYNLMPEYRRKRIDALRFEKDKRMSLGAGILLAYALPDYDTGNMLFEKSGRPYIADCPYYFNLSHSGNLAMAAVSSHRVGCDVEEIKEYNEKLAKRFFHENEYLMLKNTDDESERTRLFYRLWTLKESFIKAVGLGLSLPLDEFEIAFENNQAYVNQKVNTVRYAFKEYETELPYCFSVCTGISSKKEASIRTEFPDEKTTPVRTELSDKNNAPVRTDVPEGADISYHFEIIDLAKL